MKRDMDLIREILLKIEDYPGSDMGDIPKIEGYSEAEIYYHVWLLYDAGLIEAYNASAGGDSGPRFRGTGDTHRRAPRGLPIG